MDLRKYYTRTDIKYLGKKVATYTFGTGNHVVLCLPPFPQSGLAYVRFLETIPEGDFKFVTLDIPGWIGYSENLFEKKRFNYERMVEVLQYVIRELGIKSFSLLGYSFGASLSLILNDIYQDRVEKIVLVSPTVNGKRVRKDPYIEAMRVLKKYDLYNIVSMFVDMKSKGFIRELSSGGYPEYLLNEYKSMLKNANGKVELDSVYELFTSDFSSYLKKIHDKEVLLIVGDEDMPSVKAEVINIITKIPTAKTLLFSGPHEGFLLNPQKTIIQAMAKFLKKS